MTKVRPSLSCSSISSKRVSSRSLRSSADSGSSSSSTRGRLASARASATRWRWPPESWSRLARAEAFELDQRQHLADARRDLGLRHAVLLETEGDVALDRQVRKQRIALEHHVDRPPVRRHAGDILAVQQDAAFARLLETREHPQQRGLAAARGPEQREEFAFEDVQRQPLDGDEIAEALAHRLEPHQRLGGQTPVARIALRHADTLNAPDERLNQPVSIGECQCVQFTATASSARVAALRSLPPRPAAAAAGRSSPRASRSGAAGR